MSPDRRAAPGKGFKAKVDGKWKDYAPHCNHLLLEAYGAGCPSMRLNVKGHMYKFDFVKMQQRNLSTLENCEMRAPHDVVRPDRCSPTEAAKGFFTMENLKSPITKGRQSFSKLMKEVSWSSQRPVFVVRVPSDSAGTTLRVPHCKKLGRAMQVAVPNDAKVGQPLYLPVPRTGLKTKAKYAAYGATGGAAVSGTTVAAVALGNSAAGAGAAGAGGAAILAAGYPLIIGGVAVTGVALAAGAGVHYATKNPGKAVAIGALTIAGLAAIDHVAEVGVVEAAGDLVEGAGDLVEGAGDAVAGAGYVAEEAVEVGEDVGEAIDDLLDVGEWIDDAAGDGVDIILDLF